eukprot:CAMPEP_0119321520 /NCGR_PEP_ID=MMETSP1333-20130426/55639_1 /TAXON_ID=418940 /ORGANISM="Scyphosphaera apsteinii, Strain RCC1455" /LENGTH=206 /DNA_ID=CAMNT_0007328513 /DNA_START=338 /DNA_END=958 /DNA_ORIENTATION=+
MRFYLSSDGNLSVYAEEVLFYDAVSSITFAAAERKLWLETDEVEGEIVLLPEEPPTTLAMLGLLAVRAKVPWLGDECLMLPQQVESKLVDSELRAQRPAVRVLWALLLCIYPSQNAAIAAVERNSALVMPNLNRPFNLEGSWEVLNDMLGAEEALAVVTQNPGILASDPRLLAKSNAMTVKTVAGVVNTIDGTLPVWFRLPNSGIR